MLHPDEPRFLRGVPPVEHLATFHWLFDGMAVDESKRRFQSYCLTALQRWSTIRCPSQDPQLCSGLCNQVLSWVQDQANFR
jgi:hypothetical protein